MISTAAPSARPAIASSRNHVCRGRAAEQGRPSTYSGEIPLDFPETPRYFWIRLLE